MKIILWQNKVEKTLQHTEKGKHRTFTDIQELIEFLKERTKSKEITIVIEQV